MERHVAMYLRVSGDKQSHRSQAPALERWAAAQELPVRWYRDKFSGKTMDRPGWRDLECHIRRGEIVTVVVWKLDRLGRTTRGLLALMDLLQEYKVNLISLTEAIDLSTPAGRKFARDLASAAEYEREVIGERIREGQAAARAAGKRWGGSRPGVRRKVTDATVRTILAMYGRNEPITTIAEVTKLSRPTVYQILRSNELEAAAC